MSIDNFFVSEGFSEGLNVSSTTRKFQTSVVVRQDPNKSGILSFLAKIQDTSDTSNQSSSPIKPDRNAYQRDK
tara:strand:+ start:515 stop:733 length:219 start_codon:yes stop_codon:yes gene_type:complete